MNVHLRILHINSPASLSEKVGILATVQVLAGSKMDISENVEFEDLAGCSRWRLASVALGVPPDHPTMAVAFKRVSGGDELKVGMELRQTVRGVA